MKHNVLASLTIMWKGMLAVFIVVGIIMLAVYILNHFDKPKIKQPPSTSEEETPKAEPTYNTDSGSDYNTAVGDKPSKSWLARFKKKDKN